MAAHREVGTDAGAVSHLLTGAAETDVDEEEA